MEIMLNILMGLLQLSIVACEDNCNGFVLYDGEIKVTDVNCTVFTTAWCTNGSATFPNSLSVGTPVDPPQNLEVALFRRNRTLDTTDWLLPGATFTWNPPSDESSRRRTKGFYLNLKQLDSGKVICRLMDLQQVDLTASTRFQFQFELFPFRGLHETYQVSLASLPAPADLQLDQSLDHTVFTLPLGRNYDEEPVEYPEVWTTWICLKLHGGRGVVQATFGFPANDSLATFSSFYLQLVQQGASNPLMEYTVNRIGYESQGTYKFTNVPGGTYKVQVMPKDMLFNQDDLCQCWKPNPIWSTMRDCGTCRFTTTHYFNLTRSVAVATTRSLGSLRRVDAVALAASAVVITMGFSTVVGQWL